MPHAGPERRRDASVRENHRAESAVDSGVVLSIVKAGGLHADLRSRHRFGLLSKSTELVDSIRIRDQLCSRTIDDLRIHLPQLNCAEYQTDESNDYANELCAQFCRRLASAKLRGQV